jgi:flagellar biosynthesis protein FlhG
MGKEALKKRPVSVCISSGKGGVGKTAVSVNLALTLAMQGAKVLLVDGDLGLANVDVILGLTVKKTIRDVLDEELDPSDATVKVRDNFYVLPASSGVPEMVRMSPDDQAMLRELIRRISAGYDYVIIDSSAGIGPVVTWFNSMADVSVVVMTPDPASITDAYALMKVLATQHDIGKFYLIVNMVRSVGEAKRVADGISNVTSRFLNLKPELLGSITATTNMSRAVIEQVPFVELYPDSKSTADINRIAARLSEVCSHLE